jgi:hypothetical protein
MHYNNLSIIISILLAIYAIYQLYDIIGLTWSISLLFIIGMVSIYFIINMIYNMSEIDLSKYDHAKKIFYNLDEATGKYKNCIYHFDLGLENEKIEYTDAMMTDLMKEYSKLIYSKPEKSGLSFLEYNDYFVHSKINNLEQKMLGVSNVGKTANIFQTNKEIRKYFVDKFKWNIDVNSSNLHYDLISSYPLVNKFDTDKNKKYLYIDNDYLIDVEKIKKDLMRNSDYCLTLGVLNDSTIDIIIICANKNNDLKELKEKIENQQKEIDELKIKLETIETVKINKDNVDTNINIANNNDVKNNENAIVDKK